MRPSLTKGEVGQTIVVCGLSPLANARAKLTDDKKRSSVPPSPTPTIPVPGAAAATIEVLCHFRKWSKPKAI
jgi:hypothetical protein